MAGGEPAAASSMLGIAWSDVAWAVGVAATVWLLGWLTIVWAGRERREPEALESDLGPERTEHAGPTPVSGVLRWLMAETEADAAALFTVAPGRGERVVVEPRGLDAASIAALARAGRDALLRPDEEAGSGIVTTRWLGSGGSKALVLSGVPRSTAEEPMRFARFAIESGSTTPGALAERAVEERVRAIPGVAWAELDPQDPTRVRVLSADGIDRSILEQEIGRVVAGTGARVHWVDEPDPREAGAMPRARLVAASIATNGQAHAQVDLDWLGQPLRGRGHAGATHAGRYRAAADAMADALGPLLAGEVEVEGLYAHTHGEGELVVVVVTLDGERLVGAVEARRADQDATAARAVLDAVNRRLAVMAGGSGRI
ncbi:MAG TPA: hypothetical protein VM638_06880 [Actinomycetota bacterium]|nr:hypothetical protein [Actinomycetota bacterium]